MLEKKKKILCSGRSFAFTNSFKVVFFISMLTVFSVIKNLLMLFDVGSKSLLDCLNRQLGGQGTVKKLANCRATDDLRSRKSRHFTKSIAAVNYVAAAWLGVGNKETSICETEKKKRIMITITNHKKKAVSPNVIRNRFSIIIPSFLGFVQNRIRTRVEFSPCI